MLEHQYRTLALDRLTVQGTCLCEYILQKPYRVIEPKIRLVSIRNVNNISVLHVLESPVLYMAMVPDLCTVARTADILLPKSWSIHGRCYAFPSPELAYSSGKLALVLVPLDLPVF